MVSLITRHFHRDLRVRRGEVAPRHLWADAKAHLAFRFHDSARPRAYNTLQKLSYTGTIFVLLPLLIVSGLALSPRSEEHTSELQSLMRISYAVFCLKKKNKIIRT